MLAKLLKFSEDKYEVVLDLPTELRFASQSPNTATWPSGVNCESMGSGTPVYCLQLFEWQDARGVSRNPERGGRMRPEAWFLLLRTDTIRGPHITVKTFERLGIGHTTGWSKLFSRAFIEIVKIL